MSFKQEIFFIILFGIFSIAILSLGFYQGIRRRRRFLSNLERLGVPLSNKKKFVCRADWNFKELKVRYIYKYVHPKGSSDPDHALYLFHQRQLNLGIYLINSDSLSPDYFSVGRITSKRRGSKEIELSSVLTERLFRCWVVDDRFGKSLMSDERIIGLLTRFSDMLESYNSKFLINDSCIVISLDEDSELDTNILEAAYELSMAITSSVPASPQPPQMSEADRIFNFVVIILIIAVIAVVIFSVFTQFQR